MVAPKQEPKGKFQLGQCCITPGAQEALDASGETPLPFLLKHQSGDYGEMDAEDSRLNDEAIRDGTRIMSAYRTKSGARIWIMTEGLNDEGIRESTTILLPEEY